jgi:hypothetical protein
MQEKSFTVYIFGDDKERPTGLGGSWEHISKQRKLLFT